MIIIAVINKWSKNFDKRPYCRRGVPPKLPLENCNQKAINEVSSTISATFFFLGP